MIKTEARSECNHNNRECLCAVPASEALGTGQSASADGMKWDLYGNISPMGKDVKTNLSG